MAEWKVKVRAKRWEGEVYGSWRWSSEFGFGKLRCTVAVGGRGIAVAAEVLVLLVVGGGACRYRGCGGSVRKNRGMSKSIDSRRRGIYETPSQTPSSGHHAPIGA